MRSGILILGFILLFCASTVHSIDEPFVVGVIEFEEKNLIGLDNAGVVIPEILTSYLKGIGKYQMSERTYLKQALEEQELQLSDVVDSETASKIGKIYGLDAIITGSAMKVGDEITISGRIIEVETGEIIASGIVKFSNMKKLPDQVERLAYQLSEYTESEYRKSKLMEELNRKRLGFRVGVGAQFIQDFGFRPLHLEVFFHSRIVEVEGALYIPFGINANGFSNAVGGLGMLRFFVYPLTFLGFGFGYLTGQGEENVDTPPSVDLGTPMLVTWGAIYRANEDFRICIVANLLSWSTNEAGDTHHIPLGFRLDGLFYLMAEYFVYKDLSVSLVLADFFPSWEDISTGVELDDKPQCAFVGVNIGYRFSF